MAYTKTNWQDLPNTTTPITATRLNNMESGIENNDKRLNGTIPAGEMIVDSIRSKNMFDGLLEIGAYSFADGTKSASTLYARSVNKIPVKAGETYTLSYSSTQTISDYGFVFFNNNTYVGYIQNALTITIPSGANYAVFNLGTYPSDFNLSAISNVQLEEGTTATTYTPYQNLNGMEIYSTGETVIGTWIDGKPLYRKVINTTTPNSTNPTIVATITNLSQITDMRGFIVSGVQQILMNFVYNTEINSLYIEGSNIVFKTNVNGYLNKTCYIIVEYTKTTD